MAIDQVEQVLSNWIQRATSPPGQLAEGLDPAKWIARRFLEWWRTECLTECVERPLTDAGSAAQGIRSGLERLGGWNNPQFGEVMHELIHLDNAIAELWAALGYTNDGSAVS